MHHRILELYSGIGGMHCAWEASGLQGDIVAAVDINTVANEVYKHNFPETKLLTRNIQALALTELENFNADTILMSPPCQPFSRNGKFMDVNDPRTKSFIFILKTLELIKSVQYILMENVKGFECSLVRNMFIETLNKCGFKFQEFLLCPSNVGVPNSRLRYYCIARRTNLDCKFTTTNDIMLELDKEYEKPHTLELILDPDGKDSYTVPDNLLKRANIFDICYKDSQRSCCFTKGYSHYVEGTGSVFTEASPETVEDCLKRANNFEKGSEEFLNCLRPIKLRFFTPKEVLALMSFPSNYSFPNHITRKQCYRLIGNSVNIKVISELLKILYS